MGKKKRKAVFLGLLNNFILITVITVCALLSSAQVTEVAMIGWSKGIGSWAEMVGSPVYHSGDAYDLLVYFPCAGGHCGRTAEAVKKAFAG